MEMVPEQSSSLGAEILAGVIGSAITMACVIPPVIHLVTGPLGPFIGGVVAGNRVKGLRGRFVIGFTVGTVLAGLLAGALAVVVRLASASELPSFFPTSGSARATIAAIVFVYGTALATVGASLSGSIGKKKAES
ncbi:MAG TPA: hypothetical protein VHE30_08165 [Polyangiaceae bacterium]|nr:hypothetical protein [Polyangiaceae bacterium]